MHAENRKTHIDLFTGIGGFTLACHWNGIETVVMCENDKRCQDFLKKTWPGIPIIGDIREFDGTQWSNIFILTGGVPCQPASRAGKQRGQEDDRWLWPEAIRITEESRPTWCLFENPSGIYDVGIDGILSDLEGIGYETGIIEIPACAVNAPHIRQRVWIVAHSNERGSKDGQCLRSDVSGWFGEWKSDNDIPEIEIASQGDMADSSINGCKQGSDINGKKPKAFRGAEFGEYNELWESYLWTPCADGKFRRTPDDSFVLVDGLHRSILAALGNSIVPQIAYEIIKAIKEVISGKYRHIRRDI